MYISLSIGWSFHFITSRHTYNIKNFSRPLLRVSKYEFLRFGNSNICGDILYSKGIRNSGFESNIAAAKSLPKLNPFWFNVYKSFLLPNGLTPEFWTQNLEEILPRCTLHLVAVLGVVLQTFASPPRHNSA